MWGTNGIGYNEKMVRQLLPDARSTAGGWCSIRPWRRKSRSAGSACWIRRRRCCGGAELPGARPELAEAGGCRGCRGDTTQDPSYIRNINSSEYIEALANGDLCVAVGYNGDILQARDRARDANKGVDVKYIVPKEGSILWFDMLAIPKDAPHPEAAYAYLNYIMEPKVTADITNFKRFANANAASAPYVLDSVKSDPAIYPPPELRQKLAVQLADSPDQTRAITRLWQKFKTGQ